MSLNKLDSFFLSPELGSIQMMILFVFSTFVEKSGAIVYLMEHAEKNRRMNKNDKFLFFRIDMKNLILYILKT